MGRLEGKILVVFQSLIFCVSLIVKAQNFGEVSAFKSFPEEQVILTANTTVALSGQVIYYVFNCRSIDFENTVSDIGYVELVSESNTVIFKHKHHLENGFSSGDYFLPATVKSGHYKLIAYTQWSLNNHKHNAFDQKDVYIINPYLNAADNDLKMDFTDKNPYVEVSRRNDLKLNIVNDSIGLKIDTDSKVYGLRSKVNLTITNSVDYKKFESYSISVKKIDSINVETIFPTEKQSQQISLNKNHLPEMRGELIYGRVTNIKSGLPVENIGVSLSIPGDDYIYKSSKTNKRGEFYFNLFEAYPQERAVIQIIGDDRGDFELTLSPKLFDRYGELAFYDLKLDTNIESYIVQNSIFNQVESAYYDIKRDSVLINIPTNSFYGMPNKAYVLDDFTRFNSMKETFVEVVQEAAIRNNDGKHRFVVYDFDNPFSGNYENIKPLLLLDGLQIQDEEFLVNYNPREVASVSLVKGVYSIGSVMYNGIIDIKLKKAQNHFSFGDFIKSREIPKPALKKIYFRQNYVEEKKRIPDFRTQLLWEPNLNENTPVTSIQFYTSDISGYYLITVRAYDNFGENIILNETFRVINN
ncbi:hypothetical protein M0G43_05160 [Subsaxibacter sp. CAU 1640]|uniref:hypothetical protein n=1 Tax=Subsaxibacter sp. CAU 1640 TaxID=2933271 RepID=UPI0020058A92|nr:hypothetical protein [Subsaxibacter sp. CAU 1640]MCK7589956.1 hypothetical protein [Subsaxibacter sp. CAU 1640]